MSVFRPAFSTAIYKKMFRRHYLQLSLIFTALFIGMVCMFAYQTYCRNQEEIRQSAEELNSFSNRLLRECQNVAVNAGRSQSLSSLATLRESDLDFLGGGVDSTLFFAAQHELVSFKAMNRNIASMSVYLLGKKYMISDHGTITLESFCKSVFQTDSDTFSSYLRPVGAGSFLFIPKESIENGVPLQAIYILPLINGSGSRYGNLLLFLDDARILKELDSFLDGDMEYFIFDEKGTLILSNMQTDSTQFSELKGPLKLEKRYAYMEDKHSGWYHYVGYSPEFLNRQLTLFAVLFPVLFALGMTGLVPICQRSCVKNYTPIRELTGIITDNALVEKESELEYETLKNAVSAVFENNAFLEKQLSIYRPLLINSFLLEILVPQGQDYRKALHGLQNLGITFPFPVYFCSAMISKEQMTDFLDIATKRLTTETATCHYLSYQKHLYIMVFNCEDESHGAEAMERLLDILKDEKNVLSCGVGSMARGIRYASNSYSQALCALEYLPVKQPLRCVSFGELMQTGIMGLEKPDVLKSLETVFLAGRFLEAKENLNQYFYGISETGYVKKEHLTYAQRKILSAADKVRQEQRLSVELTRLESFRVDSQTAFEELKGACLEACDILKELFEQRRKEQTEQSSQELLAWLEEHLCDENLSLGYFAEAFQMSESKMSRRIKAMTDCTFLSYVNKKRVSYSCGLLKNTDLSIAQIAKSSGYENDITFRRIFKKYVGTTPGEYRIREREG